MIKRVLDILTKVATDLEAQNRPEGVDVVDTLIYKLTLDERSLLRNAQKNLIAADVLQQPYAGGDAGQMDATHDDGTAVQPGTPSAPKVSPGVIVVSVSTGQGNTYTSRSQLEKAVSKHEVSQYDVVTSILNAFKQHNDQKAAEYFSNKPYRDQYGLLLDVAQHRGYLTA